MNKTQGLVLLISCLLLVYLAAYFNQYPANTPKNRFVYIQSPAQRPLTNQIPILPIAPLNKLYQKKEIMVMGWNVENLFDTKNDPKTKDDEYTPTGRKRWTKKILAQKLQNITDIIRRTNNGLGPDILGFCEIENLAILKRLASHPNLRKLQYHYCYLKDGADPRGIDVALMSRYKAKVRYFPTYYGGRSILQAHFQIANHTLFVLVNHWRSRLGGKRQSCFRRIGAAKQCYSLVKNIYRTNSDADIIILGDFNDTPRDQSLRRYLKASIYKGKITKAYLYNLSYTAKSKSQQRYSYFDQIIISPGLLDHTGFSYIPRSFELISYPFMCNQYGDPLSFSRSTGRGYSDHFPVVARFQICKP